MLIGGAAGPKLFAHIAEYADGWLPIGGAGMKAALDDLRARFQEAGRDPATLHVVPMGIFPDEDHVPVADQVHAPVELVRNPTLPLLDHFGLADELSPPNRMPLAGGVDQHGHGGIGPQGNPH